MLRTVRRRVSRIEESIPGPTTAERFITRAHRLAKRTGGNFQSAISTLARDLSDVELDSVTGEFERIAFGSDTAARDAAKREAFAAAGYCPDPYKQYRNEMNGAS